MVNHAAFRSGDFDTNFVKQYFSDPKVMFESMEDEKAALLASVDQIWNQIKTNKEAEFISKPIHGAWKLMKR